MERKYLSRIADKLLDTALQASGAVLIEGPKWCGKTRTATDFAGEVAGRTPTRGGETGQGIRYVLATEGPAGRPAGIAAQDTEETPRFSFL